MTLYDVTSLYRSSQFFHPSFLKEFHKSLYELERIYTVYRQTHGVAIGNSLRCFVVEIFMCHFETDLEKNPLFPRIYHRFVDDIFSIKN